MSVARSDGVVLAEHVELGGHRRGAERDGEAPARLVEVDAVQHAVGEIALPHEHALDGKAPGRLVEAHLVGPGAAVDVEDRRVSVSFEVLQRLELAGARVREALERNRLDLDGREKSRYPGDPASSKSAVPRSMPRPLGVMCVEVIAARG